VPTSRRRVFRINGAQQHWHQGRLPVVAMENVGHARIFVPLIRTREEREALGVIDNLRRVFRKERRDEVFRHSIK